MKQTLLAIIMCMAFQASHGQSRTIILDADTGNEVDDLYAIVLALVDPKLKVSALNAAQWQASHWAVPNSMEVSYRLNEMLLGYLGLSQQVKSLRGGQNRMYDWGDLAQYSAATHHILERAKAHSKSNKLTIVVLGALTNVASAVYISPDIAGKLEVYWLGTTYNFKKNVMGKTDFNCAMDIQALDIMLKSEAAMHIMPINVAQAMNFNFQDTEKKLGRSHPLATFLLDRWYHHADGGRYVRTLWDLALVAAILDPGLVEETTVNTSAENGNRKIHYYKSIKTEATKTRILSTLSAYFHKSPSSQR